jgi:hypothetical protein
MPSAREVGIRFAKVEMQLTRKEDAPNSGMI